MYAFDLQQAVPSDLRSTERTTDGVGRKRGTPGVLR